MPSFATSVSTFYLLAMLSLAVLAMPAPEHSSK
jgi:hypothetical protein